MASTLQQVLPLVGVAIGAAGSYVFGTMTERARFRRDRRIRWEERRLQAYAEYGRALKASIVVAMRMAAKRGNCPHASPLAADDGSRLLGEALQARESAWENLLLIGRPEIISAGTEWHLAVWSLEHFAQSQDVSPERWDELWKNVDRLRQAYYKSARVDLRIDDGSGNQDRPEIGP